MYATFLKIALYVECQQNAKNLQNVQKFVK